MAHTPRNGALNYVPQAPKTFSLVPTLSRAQTIMAIGLLVGHHLQPSFETSFVWSARPHVFVAGGLSFVGRNIIPALRKAGFGVKSLAITSDQRTYLQALGCASVADGDLHNLDALTAAAKGCLYAIHCASAFVHCDTSPNEIVQKSNILITRNIIKACRRLQIKKLILQSCEAVLYDGAAMCDLDESVPLPLRPIGSCARSMQQLERIVLAANCDALQTIIVRPRLLWGRDDDLLLPSLLAQAKTGKLRLVAQGRYSTSTCHVNNACEGIICCVRYGKGGDVFFLTDGKPVFFQDFVRKLLDACEIKDVDEILSRSVPLWLARGVAKMAESLAFTFGSQPALTQSGVGLLGQQMTFNDSKARSEIGYVGRTTMAEGVADIATRIRSFTHQFVPEDMLA